MVRIRLPTTLPYMAELHGLYVGVALTTYVRPGMILPRPLSRVSLVINGLVYPLN